MTQVNVTQKSFSSGELSPELEARSNIELYQNGLSDSLNVMCTNKGDLIPRPGTEYINLTPRIGTSSAPQKARLIPFKFSDDQSYMFEFSEYCLRIYRNGKPLNWTPVAGGNTYETIQSAQLVGTAQFPIVGGVYPTESSRFIFPGEGSFQYEAGMGPFTMSDLDGSTITTLSYQFPHPSGVVTRFISNNTLLWVHSVERGVDLNNASPTYESYANIANTHIGKPADIVRLTWHPALCEGGSSYDPNAFIYAENGITARALNSSKKWTFWTATIDPTSAFASSSFNDVGTTADLHYQNFFGPTDLVAGGERTSPIPYLEEELPYLQFASVGDFVFVTHQNHQPLKIIRTGLDSFQVQNHYMKGGPWRPYPTYPNTYWGGVYHMTSSVGFTFLDSTGSSSPVPTLHPMDESSDATDYIYLVKSTGTPAIVTNADASSNTQDDIIVGRKIRIPIHVGPKWWSTNVSPNHANLESINTTAQKIRGLEALSAAAGAGALPPVQTGKAFLHQSYDSPTFIWCEGEIEAVVNTATGSKHPNPTQTFRIRITRGANFMKSVLDVRYLPPASDLKFGRLFEPVMPDQTGGWPCAVAVIGNRLVYGGNQEAPTTMAFSAVGDYDDFTPDDFGINFVNTINNQNDPADLSTQKTYNAEIFDTYSFTYTLQEGLADKILWLKSTNYGLIAGTTNGVYLAPTLGFNETYTPFNFDMRLVSEEGCNYVQAQYIDGKIFYINKLGDRLLSIQYSNEADSFRPKVESLLSEHLFKDGITSMTYSRTPINCMWFTTTKGQLISGVRLDTEDRIAFFKHELACSSFNAHTSAKVNTVAVIPSDDLSFDQLWVSATRPLPWKGLGVAFTSHWGDPATTAEARSECNTVERLTQYSPYLIDDRDFIGLDCAVHDNSYYQFRWTSEAVDYKNNYTVSQIHNWYNDSGAQDLTLTLDRNDGLTSSTKFMLSGLDNEFSQFNLSGFNTATSLVGNEITAPALNSNDFFCDKGFITGVINAKGKLIKIHSEAGIAGRVLERGVQREAGLYFFVGINNWSFFRNGLLEFSSYSHNEYGDETQYTEIGTATSPNQLYYDPFYACRTYYLRTGSGDESIPSYNTSSTIDGITLFGRMIGSQYHFVNGFKPNIYWTTLPVSINNQLGNADTSYTFITSTTVQLLNAHQIYVKNNSNSVNEEKIIDDEYTSTALIPFNVERRSGRYKTSLVQPEEDTYGKVRFRAEPGYPFRILEINLRGERATRG